MAERETRNHRVEVIDRSPLADGLAYSQTTATTHEEKCSSCGEWFRVVGVMGALRVMAEGCPKCGARS